MSESEEDEPMNSLERMGEENMGEVKASLYEEDKQEEKEDKRAELLAVIREQRLKRRQRA